MPGAARAHPSREGLTVELHDLTEERIRTALEEIEARLRLNEQVGTWDWDLVTNKLHWSELQCRQFGIDPAMGERADREIWRKSVHPSDLAPSEAALKKVIEDGVYFTFDYRIIRGGEVRWMNAHGHVFRDPSRKPVRVIGIDIDITERKRAEEAAARLAAIISTSSDAIISKALDGTVVTWNEAATRLFGYSEEEMIGHPIKRLILEQLQNEEDGILALIAADGPVQHFETLRLHKNGRLVEVSVAISAIRDAAGKVTGASQIARDITERKQAEAALRESEERLAAAVRAGRLGVYDHDLRSGRIKWDRTVYRLWGVPEGQLVTYETYEAGVHPEDVAAVRAAVRRSLDPGGTRHYECEYRVVSRADGAVRWVFADGDVMFDGDRPYRLVGVVQDITERKQAEAALIESRKRQEGLIQSAMDAIIAIDGGQRIVLFNPAAERMFGCLAAEALGRSIDRFIPEPNRQAHRDHVRKFGATGATSRRMGALASVRGLRQNGEAFPIEASISQLDVSGQKLFTVILRDITERKRHEEHTQMLLHEVNHRSKNLLAVVQAIARQTAAAKPGDFIARFGERIQALSKSQDLVVQNEWNGAGIAALVRSQLGHFTDLIGSRVELRGPSLLISASAAQTLGMALHELCTNASKYGALSNRDGRIEIGWSLERAEDGEEAFVMFWREQGGPPVTAPAKSGFGSTVTTRLVIESLDAEVDLDFAVSGLSWRLRCPVKEVTKGKESDSFDFTI